MSSLEDFLPALAAALCIHHERCSFFAQPVDFLDYEHCVAAALEPSVEGGYVALALDGVRSGRVRFDVDRARAYLESSARGACEDRPVFGPFAATGFLGTLTEGAACSPHECAEGLACVEHWTDSACAGACAPLPSLPLGARCDLPAPWRCDPTGAVGTARCVLVDRTSGSLEHRCVDHQQTLSSGEGESCDSWELHGSVATLRRCGAGLYCHSFALLCLRYRLEGEACSPAGPLCEPGTLCTSPDPPTPPYCDSCPARSYRCRPPVLRYREGESCSFAQEGATCNPYQWLSCDAGVCRAHAAPAEDEPCLTLTPGAGIPPLEVCGAGLQCGSDHRCHAQFADGHACAEGSECRSRACDPRTLRCVAPSCFLN